MKKQILDGNGAAAEAIRASNVEIVAMYPITPQSPLAEKLSLLISKGNMDSKCVCVESEHSAISYVIGAQLSGVRSTTATSSVGLALMHEVLGVAAGCHVPIEFGLELPVCRASASQAASPPGRSWRLPTS